MLSTLPIPAGTSWQQLHVVGGTLRTIAEVSFTNGDRTSDIEVGLAVTSGANASTAPAAGAVSPATSTCGVYEFARVVGMAGVKGNSPLTRALTLQPGQYVWVQANKAGVSATIQGPVE